MQNCNMFGCNICRKAFYTDNPTIEIINLQLTIKIIGLSYFRDNFLKMNIDKGLNLQECEKDIYDNYRGRWSSN